MGERQNKMVHYVKVKIVSEGSAVSRGINALSAA
jgi:hypothetical protein